MPDAVSDDDLRQRVSLCEHRKEHDEGEAQQESAARIRDPVRGSSSSRESMERRERGILFLENRLTAFDHQRVGQPDPALGRHDLRL